jgi:hypothetical protein
MACQWRVAGAYLVNRDQRARGVAPGAGDINEALTALAHLPHTHTQPLLSFGTWGDNCRADDPRSETRSTLQDSSGMSRWARRYTHHDSPVGSRLPLGDCPVHAHHHQLEVVLSRRQVNLDRPLISLGPRQSCPQGTCPVMHVDKGQGLALRVSR